MTTYAVTGASGQLGERIVRALLDLHLSPFDVIALARDTTKVAELEALGVRTREADYDRPETLAAALEGVDRLVLVSGSEVGKRATQHQAVIDAAVAAGVSRIVYTSLLKADATSNGLAPEHVATERSLTAAPVEAVLLRNSWYTENYTAQIPGYLERGAVVDATQGARLSTATRDDFAEAAAAAVTAEAPKGVYELAGDSFTMAELAAVIAEASGQPVAHRSVSEEQLAQGMVDAGMDAGSAAFWASIDASIAAGDLHTESTDLEELIGRRPTPLADAVAAAL